MSLDLNSLRWDDDFARFALIVMPCGAPSKNSNHSNVNDYRKIDQPTNQPTNVGWWSRFSFLIETRSLSHDRCAFFIRIYTLAYSTAGTTTIDEINIWCTCSHATQTAALTKKKFQIYYVRRQNCGAKSFTFNMVVVFDVRPLFASKELAADKFDVRTKRTIFDMGSIWYVKIWSKFWKIDGISAINGKNKYTVNPLNMLNIWNMYIWIL